MNTKTDKINVTISQNQVAVMHTLLKKLNDKMIRKVNKGNIWFNFQKINIEKPITFENIKEEWR